MTKLSQIGILVANISFITLMGHGLYHINDYGMDINTIFLFVLLGVFTLVWKLNRKAQALI